MNERDTSFWQRVKAFREHSGAGFTITELAVAMALAGILLVLGAGSAAGYMRSAAFHRNNELARNLFTAVQMEFTSYEQQGRLIWLTESVSGGGKYAPDEYLLCSAAETICCGERQIDAAGSDVWEGEPGDICYLKAGGICTTDRRLLEKYTKSANAWCNKDKKKLWAYVYYTERLKGRTEEEIRELDQQGTETELTIHDKMRLKLLFDLLDSCIADKESLMASICIEFAPDPSVGMVYSVFYHHQAETLVYEPVPETNKEKASLLDRSADGRRKSMTGYYGADRLVKIGRTK